MTDDEATDETFAERMTRAIDERGVSLSTLWRRLHDNGDPVARSTLAQWRTGARRPEGPASLAAVAGLEVLLGLPHGELLGRIGPSLRTGPLPSFQLTGRDIAERDAVLESFRALDFRARIPMRRMSLQMTGDIDAVGDLRTARVQLLVTAQSGTIDRFPWFQITPHSCDEPLEFTADAGCSLGPSFRHPNGRVSAVTVILDHPVEARDTALIELTTRFPEGSGIRELRLLAAIEASEALLWARFHPDAVPTKVEEFERDQAHELSVPRDPRRSVHTARKRFGPGYVGFRWS
ncbi:MAG: hypothetical protein LBU78_01425 [Microbacterium sp.]|nr:hypothetical protein [Microbacterium sp.]